MALGMAENAMALGVNEALKRTFPDDAKEDPTKRPDLIKPFLMVCDILNAFVFAEIIRHLNGFLSIDDAIILRSHHHHRMLFCHSVTPK